MKTFSFVQNSENSDSMAVYDHEKNLITTFQFGDDFSIVLKRILLTLNVNLTVSEISCEEFPQKLSNS